jgi:metal-responsive CopG/Arc/MetJ family transcriptional regulator
VKDVEDKSKAIAFRVSRDLAKRIDTVVHVLNYRNRSDLLCEIILKGLKEYEQMVFNRQNSGNLSQVLKAMDPKVKRQQFMEDRESEEEEASREFFENYLNYQ